MVEQHAGRGDEEHDARRDDPQPEMRVEHPACGGAGAARGAARARAGWRPARLLRAGDFDV